VLIKDLARANAEDVLVSYWDGEFPVNPIAIAEKLNIDVYTAKMPQGQSGMIIKKGDKQPVIYVNEKEPYSRQCFTVAHELGHYWDRKLHDDLDYSFTDSRANTPNDPHEFYADWFAANLMMPADEVKKMQESKASELDMMNHFGVSRAAIQTRLRHLT